MVVAETHAQPYDTYGEFHCLVLVRSGIHTKTLRGRPAVFRLDLGRQAFTATKGVGHFLARSQRWPNIEVGANIIRGQFKHKSAKHALQTLGIKMLAKETPRLVQKKLVEMCLDVVVGGCSQLLLDIFQGKLRHLFRPTIPRPLGLICHVVRTSRLTPFRLGPAIPTSALSAWSLTRCTSSLERGNFKKADFELLGKIKRIVGTGIWGGNAPPPVQ